MPRPAGGVWRAGLGLLRQSVHACHGFLPEGEGRALLRELANKLEVCERFQYAPADAAHAAGYRGAAAATLPALAATAAALPPFDRLWTIEGLGHAWTEAACRGGGEPRGLLAEIPAAAVPGTAWLPLHTGMGLALAARVLRALPPAAAAAGHPTAADGRARPGGEAAAADAADAAIHRFLSLCAGNARPELVTATFEALGFVAANLHAAAVPALSAALARHAPGRWTAFWHGVGRALYFSPLAMVPGAASMALARAAVAAPQPLGCHGAVAGVGWAMALVNLRDPEVLSALLARQLVPPPARGGAEPAAGQALADGLAAALLAAAAMGLGPLLEALRRPCPPLDASRWRRLIAAPCERALDALAAAGEPGALLLDGLFLYPARVPATTFQGAPSW
jgi:hypothetical protein